MLIFRIFWLKSIETLELGAEQLCLKVSSYLLHRDSVFKVWLACCLLLMVK